jgi:hypothetical protein
MHTTIQHLFVLTTVASQHLSPPFFWKNLQIKNCSFEPYHVYSFIICSNKFYLLLVMFLNIYVTVLFIAQDVAVSYCTVE